jgi:hypothetical protein
MCGLNSRWLGPIRRHGGGVERYDRAGELLLSRKFPYPTGWSNGARVHKK